MAGLPVRREDPGEAHYDDLLARFARSGTELVMVMGPRDRICPGSHWLGTVLSVTGVTEGLPTLAQAVEAGLFYPGSGRYLVAFDPKAVSNKRTEAALARSREAYRRIQSGTGPQSTPAADTPSVQPDDRADASARAMAYARNTRLKFERVYESARKALAAGDKQTALLKCKAAVDLLHEADLYGPAQAAILRKLEASIRTLGIGSVSSRR
jgi:hypothetical protein